MTPHLQELLGQLAGVISLLGFLPYIAEIVRGKTRPNRVTWWIWTAVGAVLCVSYYASGARHTVWVPVSYVLGPLVTALLSLKYGEGGADRFDRACLGASLLSLVAWWLARSPLMVLLVNIGIDALGALPTLRKTYYAPAEESLRSWSIFLLADVVNLCALGSWSVATALYPLYLCALAAVLVLLMLRPAVVRIAPGTRQVGSRAHSL
jgi:hypothetical protein